MKGKCPPHLEKYKKKKGVKIDDINLDDGEPDEEEKEESHTPAEGGDLAKYMKKAGKK